jgi:predicted RNA binding protein YcfA (HicA-like mRNA interferase family)
VSDEKFDAILYMILFLDEQIKKNGRRVPQTTPEVRFEDVRSLLEAFGFEEKRSKGSHHSFRGSQGRKITVPKIGGQKVKGVYVQQIIELLNLEYKNDENAEPEEEQTD